MVKRRLSAVTPKRIAAKADRLLAVPRSKLAVKAIAPSKLTQRQSRRDRFNKNDTKLN